MDFGAIKSSKMASEGHDDMSQGGNSFASSFKGRNTTKTAEELKKARESRAADALRMKDEQLKILSEQNAALLQSLDKVEDEANTIQMEKLAIEQENRSIRDNNFELQSKARAAGTYMYLSIYLYIYLYIYMYDCYDLINEIRCDFNSI